MARAAVILLVLALLAPGEGLAYSFTLDGEGRVLRWPADGPRGRPWLPLAGNPANTSGLTEEEVRTAVVRALQRWSLASDGQLDFDYWQGTDRQVYVPRQEYDGLSTVFFASSHPSGTRPSPMVAGHTQIWFDPATGRILEADILLNDLDWTFTVEPQEASYGGGARGVLVLDDVLAHEIGHAWGLGHSGLVTATMFTAAWAGQATPSCDDAAGLQALYGIPGPTGALTGVVRADRGAVFGGQVTAISDSLGLPVAAALTDTEGRFTIDGLPPDHYHILLEPFLAGPESLSTYYASSTDACGTARLSRSFATDGHGQLRSYGVASGAERDVGVLEADCTRSGGAALGLLDHDAPELARGSVEVAKVVAVPERGTSRHHLRDVQGTFTLTALSWSLFSPVHAEVRILDAEGLEVPPVLSLLPRWEDEQTGQAVWDARLVVTLPRRGDYVVELHTEPSSPGSWPMGAQHRDATPFVVLLASGSEAHHDPADPTSCTAQQHLPTYTSPPGPPFRRSLEQVVTPRSAGCGDTGCGQGRPPGWPWLLFLPALLARRRR